MSVKRPDPVDVEVGHRIRIERLSRGLSQTALANQLGVTFPAGAEIREGREPGGRRAVTKIAEVLGVPVGSFFSGKELLWTSRRKDGRGLAAEAADGVGAFRLLRAYAEIEDANLRRSIVDLVEQITSQRRTDGACRRGEAALPDTAAREIL
jgi:transcriptional regulator with XRE-family HTH domain